MRSEAREEAEERGRSEREQAEQRAARRRPSRHQRNEREAKGFRGLGRTRDEAVIDELEEVCDADDACARR